MSFPKFLIIHVLVLMSILLRYYLRIHVQQRPYVNWCPEQNVIHADNEASPAAIHICICPCQLECLAHEETTKHLVVWIPVLRLTHKNCLHIGIFHQNAIFRLDSGLEGEHLVLNCVHEEIMNEVFLIIQWWLLKQRLFGPLQPRNLVSLAPLDEVLLFMALCN